MRTSYISIYIAFFCAMLQAQTNPQQLKEQLDQAKKEQAHMTQQLKDVKKQVTAANARYQSIKDTYLQKKISNVSLKASKKNISKNLNVWLTRLLSASYSHQLYQQHIYSHGLRHTSEVYQDTHQRHQKNIAEINRTTEKITQAQKTLQKSQLSQASIQKKIKQKDLFIHQTAAQLKNYENIIKQVSSRPTRTRNHHISQTNKSLHWPVKGIIKTQYNQQIANSSFKTTHTDILTRDRQIKAVDGGHVVLTRDVDGFGSMIIIDHGQKYYSVYARVNHIQVVENQEVSRDQVIATFDDMEESHLLYFAMRKDRTPLDPKLYMQTQYL